MTREGQEPNPEDTFAPPASTRWSDQDAVEDDGLVAPFIPGQEPRAPRRPAPGPQASAPEATSGEPEAAGGELGTVEPQPADTPDDAFPFDMPWADAPEPGAEETAAEPSWDEPVAEEPAGPDAAPREMSGAALEEDDFPVEAFEIGHDWDRGDETGPWIAPEAAGPGAATDAPAGATDAAPEPAAAPPAAVEVAERLEWLASRLRDEGADGVERELASSDRLTSLLAALLAGHLASR